MRHHLDAPPAWSVPPGWRTPASCPGSATGPELEDFLRSMPGGATIRSWPVPEAVPPVVRTLEQTVSEGDRLSRAGATAWYLTECPLGPRHAFVVSARQGDLRECVKMALPRIPSPPASLPDFGVRTLPRDQADALRAWVASTCRHGVWTLDVVEPIGGPPVVVAQVAGVPPWLRHVTHSEDPELAGELREEATENAPRPSLPDASRFVRSLPPIPIEDPGATPRLVLFPELLGDQLEPLRRRFAGRRVSFAYSVKTNPHPALIEAALALSMDMEVITYAEWRSVVKLGAEPGRIVANGPGKWWPRPDSVTCRCLFVNSQPEFDEIEKLMSDEGIPFDVQVAGVRIRTADMRSRFGIDLDDPRAIASAARRLKALSRRLDAPWGLHFHHAQSLIGTRLWVDRCAQALTASVALADAMGSAPALVDFGGGWHARDIDAFPDAIEEVVLRGPAFLASDGTEWIFELGKSLVEPLGVVLTRVLVPDDGHGQVVVDACWGDLFESPVAAHRVMRLRGGKWAPVGAGTGALFGRSCMEHDVLARHIEPRGLERGDLLAFADAGAYDVSLSFEFATGRVRPR